MYKKLKDTLEILSKSKKIKCFFLGNTAKNEKSTFYITDIRENNKFIFASAIIFNDESAKKISKILDGKVKFILVDTEKKVISINTKKIVNIEKSTKEMIKKSEIFTYKGNDLTVEAADTFINNYFIQDIRGVGGKKILIIGSGNIGFKLGLKLVENGASVYLYRRSNKVLNNITNSINYIKPKGTIAKAYRLNKIGHNLNSFDIIIGATDGKSVLSEQHVNNFKNGIVVLDIGKGIFQKKGLETAINNKIKLFRLDVTPAYFAYLENIISTKKLSNFKLFKTKKYGDLSIATKGILTEKDTIIVDNLNKPKKIYGISDGYGSFKKTNPRKVKLIEKKLKI